MDTDSGIMTETEKTRHISKVFAELQQRLERLNGSDGHRVLESGLRDLDELMCGFMPGTLSILAALPSMGKTALALTIADHAATVKGHKTLYVTLDSTPDGIVRSLIARRAHVATHQIRRQTCTEDELARIGETTEKLKSVPLHVCDAFGLTFDDVCLQIDLAYDYAEPDNPHQLKFVVIDSLRALSPGPLAETTDHTIGYMVERLHAIAQSLDIAILLIAGLNQYCEEWNIRLPCATDLEHFYTIGAHADTLLLLHRDAYFNERVSTGKAELIIARNRFGPTGVVYLNFDRNTYTFTDAFRL